jgi:hypothetical protein
VAVIDAARRRASTLLATGPPAAADGHRWRLLWGGIPVLTAMW